MNFARPVGVSFFPNAAPLLMFTVSVTIVLTRSSGHNMPINDRTKSKNPILYTNVYVILPIRLQIIQPFGNVYFAIYPVDFFLKQPTVLQYTNFTAFIELRNKFNDGFRERFITYGIVVCGAKRISIIIELNRF